MTESETLFRNSKDGKLVLLDLSLTPQQKKMSKKEIMDNIDEIVKELKQRRDKCRRTEMGLNNRLRKCIAGFIWESSITTFRAKICC
jgi:hypothetical protein